jgi:hypothetical protein
MNAIPLLLVGGAVMGAGVFLNNHAAMLVGLAIFVVGVVVYFA